jgi:hypothetical protein|tara:strand:- start:150 stop:1406 length:1257 start_codon:yes stop_codon:yes gene_type:complete
MEVVVIEKLVHYYTHQSQMEDRSMFYIGEFDNKFCTHNLDHYNITKLKEYGIEAKLRQVKSFVLKQLMEANARRNNITYIVDLGFRVYPWYDIDCTELETMIDQFADVKGFDKLKWRFSNGYDLYGVGEQERIDWFKHATRKVKQENIIMDLVNYDVVDAYRQALPNATINYYSIYFSRMVYSNLAHDTVYEQTTNAKPYHILSLNNIVKEHRNTITNLCKQHEDKCKYTYVGKDPFSVRDPDLNIVQDRPDYKLMNSAYTYVSTETFFDHTEVFNYDHAPYVSRLHSDDITYAYITEKSLKSAFFKLPMLICGLPGSLKTWKRLGFESFPEFFDESYDEMIDTTQRMDKVKEELLKIIHTPTSVLHELFTSTAVQEKLERNQQKFFEHYRNYLKYHTFNFNEGIHPLMDKVMEKQLG